MFSQFVRFVGRRYILAKRKKTHFLISVLISVGGISLGVSALVVVLSVMNGFGQDLKDKMLGAKAHFLIESPEFKPFKEPTGLSITLQEKSPKIHSVTPFVSSEMMLRFRGQVSGVFYKGSRPASSSREVEIGSALA